MQCAMNAFTLSQPEMRRFVSSAVRQRPGTQKWRCGTCFGGWVTVVVPEWTETRATFFNMVRVPE